MRLAYDWDESSSAMANNPLLVEMFRRSLNHSFHSHLVSERSTRLKHPLRSPRERSNPHSEHRRCCRNSVDLCQVVGCCLTPDLAEENPDVRLLAIPERQPNSPCAGWRRLGAVLAGGVWVDASESCRGECEANHIPTRVDIRISWGNSNPPVSRWDRSLWGGYLNIGDGGQP